MLGEYSLWSTIPRIMTAVNVCPQCTLLQLVIGVKRSLWWNHQLQRHGINHQFIIFEGTYDTVYQVSMEQWRWQLQMFFCIINRCYCNCTKPWTVFLQNSVTSARNSKTGFCGLSGHRCYRKTERLQVFLEIPLYFNFTYQVLYRFYLSTRVSTHPVHVPLLISRL